MVMMYASSHQCLNDTHTYEIKHYNYSYPIFTFFLKVAYFVHQACMNLDPDTSLGANSPPSFNWPFHDTRRAVP